MLKSAFGLRKRFVTGIDSKNKKLKVMVSVLCNRRPLITESLNSNAASVKTANISSQEGLTNL